MIIKIWWSSCGCLPTLTSRSIRLNSVKLTLRRSATNFFPPSELSAGHHSNDEDDTKGDLCERHALAAHERLPVQTVLPVRARTHLPTEFGYVPNQKMVLHPVLLFLATSASLLKTAASTATSAISQRVIVDTINTKTGSSRDHEPITLMSRRTSS